MKIDQKPAVVILTGDWTIESKGGCVRPLDLTSVNPAAVARCCKFIREVAKLKPREKFGFQKYSTQSTARQIWSESSYGLKHWVEEWFGLDGGAGYVSNEDFILAAAICGVRVRDQNGTHCSYVFPGYATDAQ